MLAGVIAALCAAGLSTLDAACVGSFLCGLAAEIAAENLSTYSLLASDVVAYLAKAFVAVLGVSEDADANGEDE